MNTNSEYGFRNPNATTVIYCTVLDSGETARFGFWKFNKTTVYKKNGIRNQRKLPVSWLFHSDQLKPMVIIRAKCGRWGPWILVILGDIRYYFGDNKQKKIPITINGVVRFLENRWFDENVLLSELILSDVDWKWIVRTPPSFENVCWMLYYIITRAIYKKQTEVLYSITCIFFYMSVFYMLRTSGLR